MTDTSTFYAFDDYFDDPDDSGVEIKIAHRGKLLPFKIKRALPLRAQKRARDVGVKVGFSEDGQVQVLEKDDAAFSEEVVLAGLLWWPFEYEPGVPVPIKKETVAALDGTLTDALASRILGLKEAQRESLAPFVKKSDAASSQEVRVKAGS